jgi:hypothetical protein
MVFHPRPDRQSRALVSELPDRLYRPGAGVLQGVRDGSTGQEDHRGIFVLFVLLHATSYILALEGERGA